MGLILPRIRSWSAPPPSDSHATKLAAILSPRTHRDSTANPGIPGRDAPNSTLSDHAGKASYLPLLEVVVSICMYVTFYKKEVVLERGLAAAGVRRIGTKRFDLR